MKKILLFIVSLSLIFVITITIFFSKSVYESKSLEYLRSKIPVDYKEMILKKILVYRYINKLEKEIEEKELIISQKNKVINKISSQEDFFFQDEKFFKDKKIKVRYFKNDNFENYGPRAYFAEKDEILFLTSGTGSTYYLNTKNIDNDKVKKFSFEKINNNFEELVQEEYILDNMTITKGTEIINNKFYLSLVNKNNEECYTNIIFVADLDLKFLKFEEFFNTKMCIPYFDNSSGGNISKFRDNKILITIGDYVWVNEELFPKNSNLSPQNPNDYLGKILSIDLDNPDNTEIFALGTRNSQGLYFDTQTNLVFFSDHGPQGGDEVNLIKPDDILPNFGWPIVSYGEHYGFPENKNPKFYKRAPLKKPHSAYGFIEPLKYFPNQSPATSQIIKANKFENYDNNLIVLYLGTLGDTNWGSKSLHKFVMNEKYELIEEDIYNIDQRIRDSIYLSQSNKIILYLETSGSIAILDSIL
jgi:hypothetical protein|tara:strand:+ start:55 stop:1473 length:1419 start_codon:yes stop_codon:yes gene_type:complete